MILLGGGVLNWLLFFPFAEQIVVWVFGQQWRPTIPVFRAFASLSLANAIAYLPITVLLAQRRYRELDSVRALVLLTFVAILFLKDNLRVLPLPEQLLNLTVPALRELPILITTLALATIIVLFGVFSVQQDKRDVMQVRRSWNVVFVFLIFSIPGVLFIQHAWPTALLLVMVPASCYTGFSFSVSSRHIFATISFWALLALTIYNNWFANY